MTHARTILLFSLLLLGGCTVRMTYPLLEWTSYWSLGDYMELTSDQKPVARQMVADLFEWHRYEELPRYALVFEDMADTVGSEVSTEQIAGYADLMITVWDNISKQLTPMAVQLLGDFSDEQVAEMLRRVEEEGAEEREDYLEMSDEKRRAEHAKRVRKNLRRFTGRLSAEQEALIEQWSEDMLDLTDYYIAQSALWRDLFAQALALRHEPAVLQARLEQLFAVDGGLWPDDYRQAIEQNQYTSYQLMADLLNSLSDKQRRRMQGELRDLAADFNALANS